ncbi:MAG TPA: bifunctional diaminohydroxyphosphoribosylaminopyrimidine deaminase/5-amino-6-(5-phosphoribosylamino)uracil reductase RibD [Ignavibacteriaceae bacterium]|nr:bifunctional diaminohydroxyphosphoribosylaminopyrimidine deaminase/5-amino-6-(5-phosphoribosylamino)uracil reductase RibD [Ignavibacteriaceae bacterium]
MDDESYIKLTLELARKGSGFVSPNPLVGCVIVKNEKIIGAGYHQKYGESHAEINAINNATEPVEDSTLYVNLEPCSHFGKTPPCVDAIIQKGIRKVVVGTRDPNPLVSGKGIEKLIKSGIEVKAGVLEKECIELNKFFFKYITKKSPYVTLKIAQTLDGKIADLNYISKWITTTSSRKFVHKMRAGYDTVLVGAGTVNLDNPSLTVRLTEGRNPKRIVLDTGLSSNPEAGIFQTEKNVIIVTAEKNSGKKKIIRKFEEQGVDFIFIKTAGNERLSLNAVLKKIGKLGISSVLVEGGNRVFTSFIKERAFDEVVTFISPKYLGNGIPVIGDIGINDIRKSLKLKLVKTEIIEDDVYIEMKK